MLDTSRHMDAIREIDVEARRARVGPGVVQEDLNRAAQPHGLGFGPDTSTSNRATLGGMIGNNSSGSHSIVYGTTIDHVHALDVVLRDGSTATLRPGRRALDARTPLEAASSAGSRDPARPRARDRRGLPAALAPVRRLPARPAGARSSTSPSFVTGSEGTLVAITEATVGLIELPKAPHVRGRALRLGRRRRSRRPTTRSRSSRRRSR